MLPTELATALGQTLLHSLWRGVVMAVLLAFAKALLESAME
jgi:hypothetical protein